jgi:hypothetical protein
MNTQQIVSLLKEGANEIQHLRQSNSLMAARLDMFDKMISLFQVYPNNNKNGMMHPDIMYEMTKEALRMEAEALPINSEKDCKHPEL